MTGLSDAHTINALIDQAEASLLAQDRVGGDDDSPGFLFTGNFHQSIPENLILSGDLQAIDKVLWMAIRTSITNPKLPGSLPQRDELARMLNCSAPTVSVARQRLRVAGWITLCRDVRNARGQFVASIYLVHDMPLALQDTLAIDPSFITLLDRGAKSKSNRAYRVMCAQRLAEVDALLSNERPAMPQTRMDSMERGTLFRVLAPDSPDRIREHVIDAAPVIATVEAMPQHDSLTPSPVGEVIVDEIDQHLTRSKILTAVDSIQSKNLSMDTFVKSDRSKILNTDKSITYGAQRTQAVDNSGIGQDLTQSKNLSTVRSSCSSSINISNAPARARDSVDIAWDSAPEPLQSNEAMRDLVTFLANDAPRYKLTNADLAGFSRILSLYPKAPADALLDQTLGHMLAGIYRHRERIKNPTAYLKALARKAMSKPFVVDSWGQKVSDVRSTNCQPEIGWEETYAMSMEASGDG